MAQYIDSNTFDIVDNVFEVDDLIAETISTLNKKGYKTTYCCSGHSTPDLGGIIYFPKAEYEQLKEFFSNVIVVGEQVRSGVETIVAFNIVDVQELYIAFEEEYDFQTIPEGFDFYGNRLSKEFPLYEEDGKLYPEELIDVQIEKANLELLKWAKSLEYVKNNNFNK